MSEYGQKGRGYTGRKLPSSLSYVTERREKKSKDGKGKRKLQGWSGFFPYALSVFPSHPLPLLAGQPTFISVTTKVQKYFPTSANTRPVQKLSFPHHIKLAPSTHPAS
jgi:hypothetical protein